MKRTSILLSALLAALVFSQALALQAQDKEKNFYGNFTFGYRAVDTSGAYDKYREHINLEKGVRLFNFNLSYLATNDLKKLFDRIDMNVYNFGGDPFETCSLSVQKYGAYRFQFDRRKSDYFYGDQVGPRSFFDTNSFDFNRISDSGLFSLTLSKNINVFLNIDCFRATARYQRKGFNASASYLMTKTKNDIPGGADFRIVYKEDGYGDVWKASNSQFNLRLGYSAAKISASAGYSYIDFKSDTERRVGFEPYWSGPAGIFLWPLLWTCPR
jgi:hypothetical protein